MTLSDDDVRRAEKRMQTQLKAQPHATAARYDRRKARVIVSLSNGLELSVPARLAQGLSGASTLELADIEISPTGLGLHWPRLDADLYLPARRRPPPAPTARKEADLARKRVREAWRAMSRDPFPSAPETMHSASTWTGC